MVQITANASGIAVDILKSAGFTELDCIELDDMDKEALRVVNSERGMNLKNLD